MSTNNFDFIVLGAGIFGLSTAMSLDKRGYSVCVLNDGKVPNPAASSTDISKIVRLEYGSDSEYMEMAERSLIQWRNWNDLLGKKVFHETGFLLLCREALHERSQHFERESLRLLEKRKFETLSLNPNVIKTKYPAFNSKIFVDGFFNPRGGFVESGETIRLLSEFLKSIGVIIRDQSRVEKLNSINGQVDSLTLSDQSTIRADQYIFCTGAQTPRLLGMEKQFKISGHPVFHLQVDKGLSHKFSDPQMPVFSADISNTGWYGFPLHPQEGVVKIARHGVGIEVDPEIDLRQTTNRQEEALGTFLMECIPDLASAEIVYRRLCCYTDTPDGHFWIDHHHEWKNLVVATGGSGHGFKMGPELGEMIALTALGKKHPYSDRYLARVFSHGTRSQEEARQSKS